jgi:UDP:flavonoid glycosyltransferase YjiC (YdhE family)
MAPHFLFTSVPLQGHFFPALCVATALAKRGVARVTFAAYEDRRDDVLAAGGGGAVAFRSLGALDPALARSLDHQLSSIDKRLVPVERRAPRVGSTVFPFYEEHLYAPLLEAARELVAEAEASGGRVVLVCEHASLAAHDVAETLSLPLALLWQLPLFYALCMGGEAKCALARHRSVPVELPGAVLPARMTAMQRLLLNPWLKRRQMAVLCDEYVPKRRAARERSGAAAAAGNSAWRGQAPFAPATAALPSRVLHIVSGSALVEPAPELLSLLPAGWHLSGPQGVDLAEAVSAADDDDDDDDDRQHPPSVRRLLAATERDGAPLVYVAFGTLASFERERATIEAMARAFATLVSGGGASSSSSSPPPRVLWSLPPSGQDQLPADVLASLGPLARVVRSINDNGEEGAQDDPRLLVMPTVRQQALLSRRRRRSGDERGGASAAAMVRLFLSHCGLNSLSEALARGIPLVCWPLFADQHINASHAANEGCGVVVPDDGPDGTEPRRRAARSGDGAEEYDQGTRRDARAIEAILRGALEDEGMLSRARALGERMRAQGGKGGAEAATDLLLRQFVQGGARR